MKPSKPTVKVLKIVKNRELPLNNLPDIATMDPDKDPEKMMREEKVEEAVLTYQQRRRRAMNMRKHLPKIKRARELAAKRMAGTKSISKRSRKLARNAVRRRVAGKMGANYQLLSPSGKMAVDMITDKKLATINKMAKRLVPYVKQAETKRVLAGKRAPTYTRKPIVAGDEYDFDRLMMVAEQAYDYYINESKKRKTKKDETQTMNPTNLPTNTGAGVYAESLQESYVPHNPVAPTARELGIQAQGGFAHHPSVLEILKKLRKNDGPVQD